MSEKRSNARWLYIAPSIFILWVIANIDKISVSFVVTNKSFLQTMGLAGKPAETGFLLAIFIWPYAICNFLWGFVVDRYGPRKVAVASIIGWAAAMTIGGLSYSFGALAVSRIVLALAEASMWPVSLKFTASWFPHRERARAQTSYGYGQMVGFIFGTVLVTFLMVAVGWRGAFFVVAGLALVTVLPMFLYVVRDLPSQHRRVNAAERQYIGVEGAKVLVGAGFWQNRQVLGRVFRDYHYWVLVYTFAVCAVGSFALTSWLPSYLKEARHFSPVLMATWTSLCLS